MAIDNARAQEKQVQLEKTELKMELFRERELRETLEKQLAMEQKNRGKRPTTTRRRVPPPSARAASAAVFVCRTAACIFHLGLNHRRSFFGYFCIYAFSAHFPQLAVGYPNWQYTLT